MRLQDAESSAPALLKYDDHYDGAYVVCGWYIADPARAARARADLAAKAGRDEARLRDHLRRVGVLAAAMEGAA